MHAIINIKTGKILFESKSADTADKKFSDWIYDIPKLQGIIELFELTINGWQESEF